jgi:hypothetical protein
VIGAALMGSHYRTNIISSVGHPKSDLVMPLVLYTVASIFGAPMLYYRSLGTMSTLLKKDNISNKSYMRIMTYKTLVFMH